MHKHEALFKFAVAAFNSGGDIEEKGALKSFMEKG
jgi:hypothetical protein